MPDDFNKNTSIEDEIEKSLQKMVEEETTVAKAYVGNADDYKAEQPSDINDGKTRVVPKITDEILKEQQVINKSSQPTQEELTDRDILLDDDDDEEPEDEDKEILKDTTKKPLDKKTKLIIAGVAAGVALVLIIIIIVAVSLNKKSKNNYDYYYKRVADIYIMVQKGEKLSDYQFGTGFEESLDMIYFINNKNGYNYRRYEGCTAEEKETVDGWVAEAQNYLKNVAKATDKEINDMLNELYQDGYYDYKLGKSYEESFYKKYNEGGNN